MSVEVKNLFKYYGNQAAVKNISFNVNRGEIVGFLGPNGAGKSTTMKVITGYISASSGEVKVCGKSVSMDSLETRKIIGYLPENNPLYLDMYVKEYLRFVANIYKIDNVKARITDIIKKVGLELEQNKKIGALSKGYRQRVGLAQAIIHDPKVLILDEPTSGLDPNQLVEIRQLIKSIGKEKTVMLSTHIMQEVEAICDRIVIINKGEIVANDKAKDLQKNQMVQTVYVEFDGLVSKKELKEIKGVAKIEQLEKGWLMESKENIDLRKVIAKFAQQKNILTLTLRNEDNTLEEVFKKLTN
ncbi:MAG: gliding motility-associated ABC transporter ATP-binding subunit GldA [Crocinitomicaceae bacterium]|nr:gliding motility-associated ABC transporter ATP-binding subunit GldA [Crocinitomicaceae bacterium]|tara:strand:- start:5619 stop:6518 length:900 start_codon:yes stop_codon:yes gene_type:complete